MASIRVKDRSPYYFACFNLPDGSRTQRSTGVPVQGIRESDFAGLAEKLSEALQAKVTISKEGADSEMILGAREAKRLAHRIALAFEDAAREGGSGHLTDQRARKAIADVYAMANQGKLPTASIREFFESWLKQKELEATAKTHERYTRVVELLLNFLGSSAKRNLSHLTSKELASFREDAARKLGPGTVNLCIKVLRSALGQAKRDGLIDVNEAERITTLKRKERFERQPFTVKELKAILKAAKEEWQGMILMGLYTGLRLSDIATLTWGNLDLVREELQVTTLKTGRRQITPLAKPLSKYLKTLRVSESPATPLFPNAHGARQRSQHSGTLSNQFHKILVNAGLAAKRTHRSQGKGRDAKRELGGLSFHSLRHTATSLLKNSGVSDAVARDIIGHDSPAISAHYTHIDQKTKREALDSMPDVLGE